MKALTEEITDAAYLDYAAGNWLSSKRSYWHSDATQSSVIAKVVLGEDGNWHWAASNYASICRHQKVWVVKIRLCRQHLDCDRVCTAASCRVATHQLTCLGDAELIGASLSHVQCAVASVGRGIWLYLCLCFYRPKASGWLCQDNAGSCRILSFSPWVWTLGFISESSLYAKLWLFWIAVLHFMSAHVNLSNW